MSVTRFASRRTEGQSLVEFALVMPLFLLLLFGLIDFARMEFTYIALTDGAREMARVASISGNSSNSAMIDAFNNYAIVLGTMNSGSDHVTITVDNRAYAAAISAGTPPCLGPCVPAAALATTDPITCDMPLTSATCVIPPRAGLGGGTVDVAVTYQFNFLPLFQNRITEFADASVMRGWSTLTTTARGYIE